MPNTLFSTINFSQPFIQYSPLNAGVGQEPAVTTASMIRNSIMTAPMTWTWNRKEDSSVTTKPGVQDYTANLTDFGFLEKASLDDGAGNIFEVKYIYNTSALSKTSTSATQRPEHLAVISQVPGVSINLRFMGVPGKAYKVTLTYQMFPPQFGPFIVNSASTANGGNTTYGGIFSPTSFVVGQPAQILSNSLAVPPTGFTNASNNGIFLVVSCTPTQLVLANPGGVAETPATQATAINASWFPIPDNYSDIYNNLFLSEAMAAVDDPRAQLYRGRGVAALLAKQDGLNDMQKNAFAQLWLNLDARQAQILMKAQQAVQARAV